MTTSFVNKEQLVDQTVAILKDAEVNVTKKLVNQVVETFLGSIELALAEGYEVKVTKFAKFEVRPTNARTGRNPSTGEVIEIPASHRIAISPLGNLKTLAKSV